MHQKDILRRLMFGVSTGKKSKKEGEEKGKELRMRVLPEDLPTEEDFEQEESSSDEEDMSILHGVKMTTDEEKYESDMTKEEKKSEAYYEAKMTEVRRLNAIYTWGEDIPDPIVDFEDIDPPKQFLKNIADFDITEPSPIQMQSIPIMFEKRDILASAPTGSGKTLAFALPVIMEICRLKKMKKYKEGGKLMAIVIEPTRELATQTYRQFLKFAQNLPISIAMIDDEETAKTAEVVIGTPKKLVDEVKEMNVTWLRWLIVDEGDRLFDNVGHTYKDTFRSQLSALFKACDGQWTRRAFFSATYSQELEKWCKEKLPAIAMVCIGEKNSANSSVKQELIFAGYEQGKVVALRNLLTSRFDPPALVFTQSKDRAYQVMTLISGFSPPVPAALISSEKSQKERDEAIESLRSGKIWVLVCTDLMGRGLDLKGVNLVINFDLPTTIVSYIHRIGRTGRAGRAGHAITYFTTADRKYVRPIANLIHQAGYHVPEYTLSLQPPTSAERKDIYKHAVDRRNVGPSNKPEQQKKRKRVVKRGGKRKREHGDGENGEKKKKRVKKGGEGAEKGLKKTQGGKVKKGKKGGKKVDE